jgi:hypothetical protein
LQLQHEQVAKFHWPLFFLKKKVFRFWGICAEFETAKISNETCSSVGTGKHSEKC